MGRLEYLMDCPLCGKKILQEEGTGDWICENQDCVKQRIPGYQQAYFTFKEWGELIRRVNVLEKKAPESYNLHERVAKLEAEQKTTDSWAEDVNSQLVNHTRRLNALEERVKELLEVNADTKYSIKTLEHKETNYKVRLTAIEKQLDDMTEPEPPLEAEESVLESITRSIGIAGRLLENVKIKLNKLQGE